MSLKLQEETENLKPEKPQNMYVFNVEMFCTETDSRFHLCWTMLHISDDAVRCLQQRQTCPLQVTSDGDENQSFSKLG